MQYLILSVLAIIFNVSIQVLSFQSIHIHSINNIHKLNNKINKNTKLYVFDSILGPHGIISEFRKTIVKPAVRLVFPKSDTTTIFPDVTLPKQEFRGQSRSEARYMTGTSQVKIITTGSRSLLPLLRRVVGKKKKNADGSNNFDIFNKYYEEFAKLNIIKEGQNSYLPKDYKHFGVDDGIGNLQTFLRYNPFFASALTSTSTGFEIDPYSSNKATLFASLTESLNDDIPRVVATFDKNLIVTSMNVYTGKDAGSKVELLSSSFSEDDKAYMLLYTLIHYAQNIHATTHVSYKSIRYYYTIYYTLYYMYDFDL